MHLNRIEDTDIMSDYDFSLNTYKEELIKHANLFEENEYQQLIISINQSLSRISFINAKLDEVGSKIEQ